MSKALKSLQVVRKIRENELQSEASYLGEVKLRISKLLSERQRLLDSLKEGRDTIPVETVPYLRAYMDIVHRHVERIDDVVAQLREEVDRQEVVVRSKFNDKKAYDIVMDQKTAAEKHELEAKESAERDDLSTMRWPSQRRR